MTRLLPLLLRIGGCLVLAGCPETAAPVVHAPAPSMPSEAAAASSASPPANASASTPIASASAPIAQPPLGPSPFSPVLAADGTPLATPLRLYPLLGATLFVEEGMPWRIHRLDGTVIKLDAMPVRGLPEQTAWDGMVGRYPDALWMRVGNSIGGLDWFRWQPGRKMWSLDPSVKQGRRTAADLVPWLGRRLLLVLTDPQSILGAPATTSLKLLPDAQGSSLPFMPRIGPSLVASSNTGELFALYDNPPEVVVARVGATSPPRIALPWPPDCSASALIVRSSNDAFVACSSSGRSQLMSIDGSRAIPLPLPGDGTIQSLVAGKDSTLWILDGHHAVWKRGKDNAWTAVSLPKGAEAGSLVASPEDGRIWVRLGPQSDSGPTLLLTTEEVRLGSRAGTP